MLIKLSYWVKRKSCGWNGINCKICFLPEKNAVSHRNNLTEQPHLVLRYLWISLSSCDAIKLNLEKFSAVRDQARISGLTNMMDIKLNGLRWKEHPYSAEHTVLSKLKRCSQTSFPENNLLFIKWDTGGDFKIEVVWGRVSQFLRIHFIYAAYMSDGMAMTLE